MFAYAGLPHRAMSSHLACRSDALTQAWGSTWSHCYATLRGTLREPLALRGPLLVAAVVAFEPGVDVVLEVLGDMAEEALAG
jgi:hypothetical protein